MHLDEISSSWFKDDSSIFLRERLLSVVEGVVTDFLLEGDHFPDPLILNFLLHWGSFLFFLVLKHIGLFNSWNF